MNVAFWGARRANGSPGCRDAGDCNRHDTSSGARAYIFEARLFGKTIRTTTGDTRTWELGQARAEASRLRSLIDVGLDPREHRAEQQVAHAARQVESKRRDVTFGQAWDEYVAARKPSWGDPSDSASSPRRCASSGWSRSRSSWLVGRLCAAASPRLDNPTSGSCGRSRSSSASHTSSAFR